MKHTTLLSSLLLAGTVAAQTEVTISTAPANADQVFYSLANGVVATKPLADWDLAFEISGFTSSILVNTAKGHLVYHTGVGVAEWASVTAPDETNWTALNNSETNWSEGALTYGNDLNDGGFNLGWGTYNMATHIVAGTEVYAIQFGDGTWKKLRIDGLAGGVYAFTYADLDGNNEHTGTLVKADFAGKNFGYWNLTTNASVDQEPVSVEWDLLFTKYFSYIPSGEMWYSVAGVLHNAPVQVAQLDGVDPATVGHAEAEGEYALEINTIGSDWKTFNMETFQYEYATDRAYFVQDMAGNIWKLIFTNYGGGSTGSMTFTQELMSATAVDERSAANGRALVFPNPVTDGTAQVLFDVPAAEAVVTMHDLGGKLVRSERFTGLTPLGVRSLDLNGVGAGVYTLRVEHATGVATAKLVVN